MKTDKKIVYTFLGELNSGIYHLSNDMRADFAFGEEEESILDWEEILFAEDRPVFAAYLKTLRECNGALASPTLRLRTKSGNHLHLRCFGCVLSFTEGQDFFTGCFIPALSFPEAVAGKKSDRFLGAVKELMEKNQPFGLLVIGIDDFKQINDLESYAFGDLVLEKYASMLRSQVTEQAYIYRLEGDSFGILYPYATKEILIALYHRLQMLSKQPLKGIAPAVTFTISAGICLFSQCDGDEDILYRNARIALRNAKNNGKNQYCFYTEDALAQEKFHMRLLESLKGSILNDYEGFFTVFQPIIAAKTKEVCGCEVLLRYEPSNKELQCGPSVFIPLLENSGMMPLVGRWVLEKALQQLSLWLKKKPNFQMSINATCEQFENPSFKLEVMEMLHTYNIPPASLILELTESQKITDTSRVRQAFDFLRSQGVKIALDDFGTGYASLEIFRNLRVDELKIDKSFLEHITYDITDQRIVRQMISLCHSMHISVCVEGIENKETEAVILEFEPEALQGYYYDMPLTRAEFEAHYLENVRIEQEEGEQENLVFGAVHTARALSMEKIINSAHAGIIQVGLNQEFSFITCNEGYRRMLGYTAKEIEERFHNHALGLVHPEDAAYVNEEVRRQLRYSNTAMLEFRIVRADGSVIWVLGAGSVVKDSYGNASLVAVIVNAHENKMRQLEEQRKQLSYEKILEEAPVGIIAAHLDEMLTLEEGSCKYFARLGYEPQEITHAFDGKYLNMIYRPDRKRVLDEILKQQHVSEGFRLSYHSYCKEAGALLQLEALCRVCVAEDGIPRIYFCIIHAQRSGDEK